MKTAIIDVDNTLLNWHKGFAEYMDKEGHPLSDSDSYDLLTHYPSVGCKDKMYEYVVAFNSSDGMLMLEPMQYMQAYIEQEIKPNYDRIIALTCFSRDWRSHIMREINIKTHYPDIFDKIICKALGESKLKELREYNADLLIDDAPKYIAEGQSLGIRTIILDMPYNQGIIGERLNLIKWATEEE
jgi:hypothetical protein